MSEESTDDFQTLYEDLEIKYYKECLANTMEYSKSDFLTLFSQTKSKLRFSKK